MWKVETYVAKKLYMYFTRGDIFSYVGLWAVVNNAGVAGVVSHFEWLTKTDYDQVLGVNLYGVILVTTAFLPLVRHTPGRIINMASVMGRFTVATAPYTVSKFGVEGFSDAIRYVNYR